MKRLKKENLRKKEFFPKYLRLVNVILPDPLTQREIDVLAAFMQLEGDLVREDRFGTQARSVVRKKFGFKTYSNLDNYIRFFKKKGVIQTSPTTGKLVLSPKLAIPEKESGVELTFAFNFKDE